MSTCSIVIPVHDNAGVTRRCLDELLAKPPKAEFEIVVVDDASTDSTAELLTGYGDALTVVTHRENLGFGASCNDGASPSAGEFLVFLNNDTVPLPGWLDALVAYAERHPRAAVVGSRLLYANDTIQHAGVVFSADGKARHLYVGFPADDEAVNKSRRFQAVTFACALVRREAFEEMSGFDTAFENDLEDVDLCLRLGQAGHEVHYCADSVLYHLESVSRGRQLPKKSAQLYRERWAGRVLQDDLHSYVEDGLLQLEYKEPYPLRITVSPKLATVEGGPGTAETDELVHALSRQVLALLGETARLTVKVADLELGGEAGESVEPVEVEETPQQLSRVELQRRTRAIELQLQELQAALAAAAGPERFSPGEYLDYRKLLVRIRELVTNSLPGDSVVLVVSRGDDELLGLDGRRAWHFPRADDGTHQPHHPPDSAGAIEHLEALRHEGAEYLLVPKTELWWLEHYPEFGEHLESRYPVVVRDEEAGVIFSLRSDVDAS
jgi:GT2 family glycosyltransferase